MSGVQHFVLDDKVYIRFTVGGQEQNIVLPKSDDLLTSLRRLGPKH